VTLDFTHTLDGQTLGILTCVRTRIDTYLALKNAAMGTNSPLPATLPQAAVVLGDKLPTQQPDGIRLRVLEDVTIGTTAAPEVRRTYRVEIMGITRSQIRRTPAALPTDPDPTIQTSAQLRASGLADAAALALERYAEDDVPGAFSTDRLTSAQFTPRERDSYGFLITVLVRCRARGTAGEVP